ncbi:MAG: hypothetical protein ACE5GX_14045 [Thermoanaerobaculia bacterium]
MKSLLLQVRGHAKAEAQEIVCFSEALGTAGSGLDRYNLVSSPRIIWRDVEAADLLLLGGAGEHSVTKRHDFTPYLDEVLGEWIEAGRPFFGSCYGHHVLARLFGAEVIRDPSSEEVGTFDISLTPAGLCDPLFGTLPRTFSAQLGHHDRVSELPEGLVELARSKRCAIQAARVGERPAYSTQFHPEITEAQMRDRLMMYRDSYLDPDVTLDSLIESLGPTVEAGRLLKRFLEIYF